MDEMIVLFCCAQQEQDMILVSQVCKPSKFYCAERVFPQPVRNYRPGRSNAFLVHPGREIARGIDVFEPFWLGSRMGWATLSS